ELQPGILAGDPSAAKAESGDGQEFAALKRCATQNPSAQNLSTEDPECVVSSEQEQAAIMPGGDARRYIDSGSGAGSAIVASESRGRGAPARPIQDARATGGGCGAVAGLDPRRPMYISIHPRET